MRRRKAKELKKIIIEKIQRQTLEWKSGACLFFRPPYSPVRTIPGFSMTRYDTELRVLQ